jgi:hypothetical protein
MKSFTKICAAAAAAAVVTGAAACSRAPAAPDAAVQPPALPQAQQPPHQPGAVTASLINASAKVQKIDKATRQVTLEGPEGRTFDVKAGLEVDLDRLHVGDTVTATYYDEVAAAIEKASTGAVRMTTTTVQRGGVTASQATMTARIVSVDPANNSVVIRSPLGGEHTLKVQDPGLQARLKEIKPGESFDVTYTQAVAVSIEPQHR